MEVVEPDNRYSPKAWWWTEVQCLFSDWEMPWSLCRKTSKIEDLYLFHEDDDDPKRAIELRKRDKFNLYLDQFWKLMKNVKNTNLIRTSINLGMINRKVIFWISFWIVPVVCALRVPRLRNHGMFRLLSISVNSRTSWVQEILILPLDWSELAFFRIICNFWERERGFIPYIWTEVRIVPVPKKGKDPTKIENYRPNSLLCVPLRVFHRDLPRN